MTTERDGDRATEQEEAPLDPKEAPAVAADREGAAGARKPRVTTSAAPSRPLIFAPHLPMRRDPETRAFVPSMDLRPVSAHGQLRFLIPGDHWEVERIQSCPDEALATMTLGLAPYDHARGDALLLVGSPLLMALMGAAAAPLGRPLRFLLWQRQERVYEAFEAHPASCAEALIAQANEIARGPGRADSHAS